MQIREKIKNKKGFTLIETMIYAVGLVLLIITMSGLMYYMYNWYQYATISSKVDQLGLTLTDKIVRDIRSGKDINLSQSSFGVANGYILIDSTVNGTAKTKKYSLANGRIQYQEDGGVTQYISPDNITVSRLLFIHLSTSISDSVRTEIELTYDTRSGTVTHDFDGLSILRQSY